MGGHLHLWVVGFVFFGSHGGSAVVGGCWCSWAIMKAVVVKSMVGGSDKHGWWWWEESDCQTNIVCLGMNLTCMISHDDLRLVLWKSTRCSMDFKFFSWNQVRLCTELQE